MSDTSGAFPPPPPPSVPPPVYGAPPPPPQPSVQLPKGYKLPAGYQGPTAPDYATPYQQQPYQQTPWGQQQPQALSAGSIAYGSASSILSQFGGPATYSIIVGVLGIALPIVVTGYYFRVLPLFGLLAGIRAVLRGKMLGGAVGIGANVLAGIFSLIGMGLIGG